MIFLKITWKYDIIPVITCLELIKLPSQVKLFPKYIAANDGYLASSLFISIDEVDCTPQKAFNFSNLLFEFLFTGTSEVIIDWSVGVICTSSIGVVSLSIKSSGNIAILVGNGDIVVISDIAEFVVGDDGCDIVSNNSCCGDSVISSLGEGNVIISDGCDSVISWPCIAGGIVDGIDDVVVDVVTDDISGNDVFLVVDVFIILSSKQW